MKILLMILFASLLLGCENGCYLEGDSAVAEEVVDEVVDDAIRVDVVEDYIEQDTSQDIQDANEEDVFEEDKIEEDVVAERDIVRDTEEVEGIECMNDDECITWCQEDGWTSGHCWTYENEETGKCFCPVSRSECECE